MSTLFNKVSQGANQLYNKAMGGNGIFNKIDVGTRKFDNSVQRVGHFLRPIANHFGLGDTIHAGVGLIHSTADDLRNANRAIRNNLEKSVKAPIGDIHKANIYH